MNLNRHLKQINIWLGGDNMKKLELIEQINKGDVKSIQFKFKQISGNIIVTYWNNNEFDRILELLEKYNNDLVIPKGKIIEVKLKR